jgi:hypothetical protein
MWRVMKIKSRDSTRPRYLDLHVALVENPKRNKTVAETETIINSDDNLSDVLHDGHHLFQLFLPRLFVLLCRQTFL